MASNRYRLGLDCNSKLSGVPSGFVARATSLIPDGIRCSRFHACAAVLPAVFGAANSAGVRDVDGENLPTEVSPFWRSCRR
jgi:hypothetical protein